MGIILFWPIWACETGATRPTSYTPRSENPDLGHPDFAGGLRLLRLRVGRPAIPIDLQRILSRRRGVHHQLDCGRLEYIRGRRVVRNTGRREGALGIVRRESQFERRGAAAADSY